MNEHLISSHEISLNEISTTSSSVQKISDIYEELTKVGQQNTKIQDTLE